jgi:hypothetical protein
LAQLRIGFARRAGRSVASVLLVEKRSRVEPFFYLGITN